MCESNRFGGRLEHRLKHSEVSRSPHPTWSVSRVTFCDHSAGRLWFQAVLNRSVA